jgi:hypothetical protein
VKIAQNLLRGIKIMASQTLEPMQSIGHGSQAR